MRDSPTDGSIGGNETSAGDPDRSVKTCDPDAGYPVPQRRVYRNVKSMFVNRVS
jgi:hypothetical protein